MKVIERLLGLLRLYTTLYSEFDLIQTENKVKSKYKPLVIVIVAVTVATTVVVGVIIIIVNDNMIID